MSGEIILYTTDDGLARVQLRMEGGTVWLTQLELAELFQTTVPNINIHIKNILDEGELGPATIKDDLIVRQEGPRRVQRPIKAYSLDMILAVGYRVRSHRGTQFRQWATAHLKEYLAKGFIMDDARLKEPDGWDYFDELMERIREIRASEKRFYQKVRDIFTTAVDYDPRSEQAQIFFKKVQNKMLWSVTGHTAAELIVDRADPAQPNMGLQSWRAGRVRQQDVTTAKNYLGPVELEELNNIVVMYLDHALDMAKRRKTMTMGEWEDKLDAFMQFNERDVLTHAGKISAQVAEKLALERYAEYDEKRREIDRLAADKIEDEALEEFEQRLESRDWEKTKSHADNAQSENVKHKKGK